MAKWINSIIHNDQVFKVSVLEHPQVLNVHIVFGLDAMLPVEPVLEVYALGIYVV